MNDCSSDELNGGRQDRRRIYLVRTNQRDLRYSGRP